MKIYPNDLEKLLQQLKNITNHHCGGNQKGSCVAWLGHPDVSDLFRFEGVHFIKILNKRQLPFKFQFQSFCTFIHVCLHNLRWRQSAILLVLLYEAKCSKQCVGCVDWCYQWFFKGFFTKLILNTWTVRKLNPLIYIFSLLFKENHKMSCL